MTIWKGRGIRIYLLMVKGKVREKMWDGSVPINFRKYNLPER